MGGGETHYYFVLLCRMFTFTKILPVSVFAFDWSSQNVSPPPPSRPPPPPPPPPKSSSTLCVIYAPSGKGVCPHCIPCCVTDQSIEMLPLFPLCSSLFFPSIPSSPTSARQPIHLMQFPPLALTQTVPPPLLSPAPLSLPLSFAQVMSYFFSWILLPPSLALQGFPLAGGFPQRSILSTEGREWEDVLRRDV